MNTSEITLGKMVSFWVFVRILVIAILVTLLHAFHVLPPVAFTEDKVLQLPVHRALMFDYRGAIYGSRSTFLRGDVVLGSSIAGRVASGNKDALSIFADKTVFLPCEDFEYHDLEAVVNLPVRGLVVEYCPNSTTVRLRNEAINRLLLSFYTPFPVYFLSPGSEEKVAKMRESCKEREGAKYSSSVRLSIKVGDKVPKITPEDNEVSSLMVKGVLKPKKSRSTSTSAGVHVLLSAHFDTLTSAPSIPTVSNALGVPALMELWRRFAFNSGEVMRGTSTANVSNSTGGLPYIITMLFGSSSHLRFQGTEEWLRTEKPHRNGSRRPLVSICLDELLPIESEWEASIEEGKHPLYMHIHQGFSETEEGIKLISKVKAAALATGVEVEIVPSSQRYSRSNIHLEYQVFNHFKLPAVTFSAFKEPGLPPVPAYPHVGNERLMSHLSQENKDSSRLTVRNVLMERVNFFHALLLTLIAGDEPVFPSEEEEGGGKLTFPENDRFLVAQIQRALRSLRSTSTLEVNSTAEFPSVATYVQEVIGTLKAQIGNYKSSVSASVDLQEWFVPSPSFLLYPSPAQTMIVFQGMTLVTKLMWTGVGIVILALAGWFHYHQFPSPKSNEKDV